MKRVLSFLIAAAFAAAAALPAWADDDTSSSSESSSSTTTVTDTAGTQQTSDLYLTGYTVTDTAGGEVSTVEWGDHINIVLRVIDHASARYSLAASDIVARINSAVFTHTGAGEIGQVYDDNDDPDLDRRAAVENGTATDEQKEANAAYNYYSYVILFRDVVYNGSGNTLPLTITYLDTTKPMQQLSVTIGQCHDVDPDDPSKAKTPGLVVRESGYGDGIVNAGEAFTLTLGVYATTGSETLNDVVVSLTLPENVSLNGGSLSNYVGAMAPGTLRSVVFSVLPSSAYKTTVADIKVEMTGTGANSGKTVTGSTTISVPISQPDRFELGQLELSESVTLGESPTVTLSYVNKGKNTVSNLEATLAGTNLGASQYRYLGNLDAGKEGSVDFDLTPEQAGTLQGTITLSYEGLDGKTRTLTKDFSSTVEELDISLFDTDIDAAASVEPEKTGLPGWGIALIAVGAAAAAAAVFAAVKKRRKAKALAGLEDDGDEDL